MEGSINLGQCAVRSWWIFALICVWYCAGAQGTVTYIVSPVLDQSEHLVALKVQMNLMGDADGETQLRLPNVFGSANHLYRCFSRLRSESGHPILLSTDSLDVLVKHDANDSISISYEVCQDWEGAVPSTILAFRPWINAAAFHILGVGLFIAPYANRGYRVSVQWQGFPPNWLLHNSYGTMQMAQTWNADDARWMESVFIGGTGWRLLETKVADQPIYLAIRGDGWAFSDTAVLFLLNQTVAYQRFFWKDYAVPYYTVTIMPMKAPEGYTSYLGTGLIHSFAVFATPVTGFKLSDLDRLFHHELMHDWIGVKIRNGGQPNDMQLAWFSEGFTEYFSYLNQLSCGSLDTNTFIIAINERFFKGLWESKVAEQPNSYISANFFKHRDANELPYLRGFVFAYHLDRLIEQKSQNRHGLHDVLLEFLNYYYKENRDVLTGFEHFLSVLTKETGQNIKKMHEDYITNGKLIPSNQLLPMRGFSISVNGKGQPRMGLKQ
jgi:predicted metalloprotease with PDZ domain